MVSPFMLIMIFDTFNGTVLDEIKQDIYQRKNIYVASCTIQYLVCALSNLKRTHLIWYFLFDKYFFMKKFSTSDSGMKSIDGSER